MGKTKVKKIEDIATAEEEKVTKISLSRKKEDKTEAKVSLKPAEKQQAQSEVKTSQSKKPRSKKYQQAIEMVDMGRTYPIIEAVELAQASSYSNFKGSIEAHINTRVKNIRGLASLPHAAGKKLVILAFGKGAAEAGADIVGTDETLQQLEKGKIKVDVIVTTAEWMPKLARLAKVLGPKGLMPNPKNDTVTENLSKTISELQSGKTEYKTEKDGKIIHLTVGKVEQPSDEVTTNIKVLYQTIGRSKISAITLASSMGPGVKVDLSSM